MYDNHITNNHKIKLCVDMYSPVICRIGSELAANNGEQWRESHVSFRTNPRRLR